MVMVGGRGSRLNLITKSTAKPAVSFAGKFRLIDFVLSNLSNSGIYTAGIITQYEPHELMSYIEHGSTWDLDVNEGGISFLTPYTSVKGDVWQKGTAHAIRQHFKYIDQYEPENVLILSGDHIYKMDYSELIDHHKQVDADVTIGAFTANHDADRFGIIESNSDNQVIGFEEKPQHPKSNLASMGIYVFKREVLRTLLNVNTESSFDFGKDILPIALKQNYHISVYQFDGYFRDVGTVDSLYKANMDLLDNPQLLKLHEYVDFPIYTKSSNLPPHHVGTKAIIRNSMISDGCLVLGDIYHSVLSSRIVVGTDAVVRDSIIYRKVTIGDRCDIKNAIILGETTIPPDTSLVFDEVTVVDSEFIEKLGETNG